MLGCVAAVVVTDALWLLAERARAIGGDRSFARATGGLGLGVAMSPEWSLFDVDARFESECESELFPIPGLACPDPVHGSGIVTLPPRR